MGSGAGLFAARTTARLLLLLSGAGVALIQALSSLTGLQVQAPMGLATGSFQNGELASARRWLLGNPASRLLTSGYCRPQS